MKPPPVSHLPPTPTPATLATLRDNPSHWLPIASTIASAPTEAVARGSFLVAFAGDRVVKLVPPFARDQASAERDALVTLAGRLPVATPSVLAHGEIDGWSYLVTTRLPGTPLDLLWSDLDERARIDLLAAIGVVIAATQRVPPGPIREPTPSWSAFLAAQRQRCVARHTSRGMPSRLVADIETALEAAQDDAERPAVILTGEWTPSNLLVERRGPGYALTGAVDFGDAMAGDGDYDLLGPSTFLCDGSLARVAALFSAYDGRDGGIDPRRRARLLRLLLLHRFSDFDVQIRLADWKNEPSLATLAERLWPSPID